MTKKLFNIDNETKKTLQSIASTYLVTQDVVNKVWEYTIFTLALKIAAGEGNVDKLTIPYIGNLYITEKGKEVDENGVAQPNLEWSLELSDTFKEIYKNVKQGSYDILSEYFDEQYIQKVVNLYKES